MPAESNPYDVRLAFVLDDEARLGIALSKMLATIGISARAFVGPEAFLHELEQAKPDLIFLDLALGQSDAIEVIRQLEARKFAGRVMLISGRDTRTLLEVERIGRAHGLHMLPSLPKPFRMADIKDNLLPSPTLQPALSEDLDIDNIVPLRFKA
ncbi:MAG TPA: response regulator [Xanthobacteraceae bacterium]